MLGEDATLFAVSSAAAARRRRARASPPSRAQTAKRTRRLTKGKRLPPSAGSASSPRPRPRPSLRPRRRGASTRRAEVSICGRSASSPRGRFAGAGRRRAPAATCDDVRMRRVRDDAAEPVATSSGKNRPTRRLWRGSSSSTTTSRAPASGGARRDRLVARRDSAPNRSSTRARTSQLTHVGTRENPSEGGSLRQVERRERRRRLRFGDPLSLGPRLPFTFRFARVPRPPSQRKFASPRRSTSWSASRAVATAVRRGVRRLRLAESSDQSVRCRATRFPRRVRLRVRSRRRAQGSTACPPCRDLVVAAAAFIAAANAAPADAASSTRRRHRRERHLVLSVRRLRVQSDADVSLADVSLADVGARGRDLAGGGGGGGDRLDLHGGGSPRPWTCVAVPPAAAPRVAARWPGRRSHITSAGVPTGASSVAAAGSGHQRAARRRREAARWPWTTAAETWAETDQVADSRARPRRRPRARRLRFKSRRRARRRRSKATRAEPSGTASAILSSSLGVSAGGVGSAAVSSVGSVERREEARAPRRVAATRRNSGARRRPGARRGRRAAVEV